MKSQLPHQLDDALKRILRHNGAPVSPRLVDHLGQLINWIIETEQIKSRFGNNDEPIPLISLLGNIGIYGKDYVDKVTVVD